MTDDRLMDLEVKFAHQEHAIERLEKNAFEQQRLIADLEKRLERLADKFAALGPTDVGPSDQKPPHY